MGAGVVVVKPWGDALDALHDQVALGRVQCAAGRAGPLDHLEVIRGVHVSARAEDTFQHLRKRGQRQRGLRVEVATTAACIEQGIELVHRHAWKFDIAPTRRFQECRRRNAMLGAKASGRIHARFGHVVRCIDTLPTRAPVPQAPQGRASGVTGNPRPARVASPRSGYYRSPARIRAMPSIARVRSVRASSSRPPSPPHPANPGQAHPPQSLRSAPASEAHAQAKRDGSRRPCRPTAKPRDRNAPIRAARAREHHSA